MSMKRGILALGVAAMLAFAAFAFGERSTANACCAGDPTLTTENAMTILPVGSPVTVPGGTVTYNINVSDVNNLLAIDTDGLANVIYKGFQWEVATGDSTANFVSFTHPNQTLTGLTTCSAPASSFPLGPGVVEFYGGGSGCISLGPEAGTRFVGTVATVTVQCKSPVVTGIALLGFDSDALFGTTTSDATGATIPTELYNQQPNPNFPAFGPPTLAVAPFICLDPVDVSIVKSAPATANVGGTGTYTLTITHGSTAPVTVNVTDTNAAGVTATAVAPAPCVVTGGGAGVSCPGLVVPPGAGVVVTIDVTFDTCGSKANTATVSPVVSPTTGIPNFADPNPANNTSTATTVVDCAALTVTKTGPAKAISGDTVVYNVQICNDAGTAATNVVVSDTPGPAPVPATYASIASGSCVISTVTVVTGAAGTICNTASATQDPATGGPSNQSEACTVVNPNFPDFNGLRKDCDPSTVTTDRFCNIFLQKVGPDKTPTGTIVINEQLNLPPDIDTCNDDDDGDGFPCAGNPNLPPAPFQADQDLCLVVAENYIPHQTSVDCDGKGDLSGELPEGLGAIEFQIKYDHKLFQQPVIDCTGLLGSTGRIIQPVVSVITENWTLFGCVTKSPQPPNAERGAECANNLDDDGDGFVNDGCPQVGGASELGADCNNAVDDNDLGTPAFDGAINDGCPAMGPNRPPVPGVIDPADIVVTVTFNVQLDLFQRIRPTKDNGVVTDLLDENCEAADIFGMPWPGTVQGGLLVECGDATITIRMLEGDIDLDCDVDIADDQGIAFRYGSFFGHLLYNRFFDLEPNIAPDFDIDIKDLQTVFGRNGSTCDAPIPDQVPGAQIPDP